MLPYIKPKRVVVIGLRLSKKSVIISACILGEYCRYDGKTKMYESVINAFEGYKIIPFCPEAPLFGTPRERISVVEIDGENRILTDETSKDVTRRLEDEIEGFIKCHQSVDAIVLKSKSPSCGNATTPILNRDRELLYRGDGIAAKMFKEFYQDINIEDENNF